jgi:hypothetical protein
MKCSIFLLAGVLAVSTVFSIPAFAANPKYPDTARAAIYKDCLLDKKPGSKPVINNTPARKQVCTCVLQEFEARIPYAEYQKFFTAAKSGFINMTTQGKMGDAESACGRVY